MPNFRRPLSRYPAILTEDFEQARQQVFEIFGADTFDVADRAQLFLANFLRMHKVGICYAEYGSAAEIGFPAATFARQLFNISGRGRFEAEGAGAELSGQMLSPVIPADGRFAMRVGEPYRQLVLRIETQALRDTMVALAGEQLQAPLTFDAGMDNASALSASFKREVLFFTSELNAIGTALSSVAVSEIEQSLVTRFLIYNRNNYSNLLLSEAQLTANSKVKLVEDYIEAHWREPLDISALALLTNTSVRSLFRQFRKSRDYSPMEFLKLTRLRRARQMLLAGEDRSVMSVMLKCGFQNAGHFARDYRRAFGERPSETLRRASS